MDKNKPIKTGRTLYFEPNPLDNDILPTENYNIFVDLTSTRKSRSVITANNGVTEVYNTGKDKSVVVRFIEGSNFYGENKSLTTRYTEEKKSNPGNNESEIDDLESLGIESISIDFDTAYTPLIKIRFIDIRGKAIMQEGGNSKYKMFFELPYPTFNLTVKGYYGNPVTYCLHLTKWNSNFNSDTGNFEIDAEFIGYTYALLTDLLVGLLRAVVRTEIGKPIFDNLKEQYKNNTNNPVEILSIDEVIKKINEINNELNQLGSDNPIIQDTARTSEVIKELNDILINVNTSFNVVYSEDKINEDGNFIIKKYEASKDKETIKGLEEFKKSLKEKLEKTNELVKIKVDDIIKIEANENVTKDETITNPSIKDEIIKNTSPSNNTFTYFDFTLCKETLNSEIDKLNKELETLTKKSGDIIAQKTKDVLGFESTIRNIIRVFAIHSEVLLKTIQQVSTNAEGSEDRKNTLDKLFAPTDASNISEKDIKDRKYFAWPEYRKLSDGEITETWLGSELKGDEEKLKVDEVKFVEEILSILLKIGEEDAKTQETINSEIDGVQQISSFTPISTIDTSFFYPNSPTTNPYRDALFLEDTGVTGIPDEAMRVMLMRAFILMGVSNVNYPTKLSNIIAKNEALMLYKTIKSEANPSVGKTLIDEIKKIGDTEDKVKEFINYWKIGSDNIKNPTGKKTPLLEEKVLEEIQKSVNVAVAGGSSFTVGTTGSGIDTEETIEKTKYYKYTYIGANGLVKVIPTFKNSQFTNNGGRDLLNNPTGLVNLEIRLKAKVKGVNIRKEPNADASTIKSDLDIDTDLGLVVGYENVTTFDGEFKNINWFKLKVGLGTQFGWVRADVVTFNPIEILDERYYIPVSNRFDGQDFYNGEKLKNRERLKSDLDGKPDLIYVTKPTSKYITSHVPTVPTSSVDDGSKLFKIINTSKYNGSSPNEWLIEDKKRETYLDSIKNRDLLNYGSLIKDGTYDNKSIEGLDPYGGQFMVQEFFNYINLENEEDQIHTVFYNTINNSNLPYLSSYMSTGFKTSPTSDVPDKELFYSANTTYIKTNHNSTLIKPENLQNYGYNQWIIKNILFREETPVLNEDDEPTTWTYKDIYTPDISFGVKTRDSYIGGHIGYFSLFGSPFYYSQKTDEARAYLFLHSLPLMSSNNKSNNKDTELLFDKLLFLTNEDKNPLKGLFNTHSGFIKSPYLWCAHIGSLLYRYDEFIKNKKDILTWNLRYLPISVNNKFIYQITKVTLPRHDQFLYVKNFEDKITNNIYNENNLILSTIYNDGDNGDLYKPLDKILLNLPTQIRNQFKDIFTEFLNEDFSRIKKEFEILKEDKSTGDDLIKGAEKLLSKIDRKFLISTKKNGGSKIEIKDIKENGYIDFDKFKRNYLNITPYNAFNEHDGSMVFLAITGANSTGEINYHQFRLLLNPKGEANKLLNELYEKEVVIINNTPSAFMLNESTEIRVKKTQLDSYIKSFFTEFNSYVNDSLSEEQKIEEDNIKQSLFNSIDDDFIKLNLYRTIGSISNKWISGSNEINFNGCSTTKNIHKEASLIEGNKTGNASLIDTFKFLDRAFNDIGDDFFINPTVVRDLVVGNNNQSFFDVVNRILSDNNFNFIPLPSFTNFNKPEKLAEIFQPNPFVNSELISGPTFVCVYAGQTSSALSLGDDSNYPDDGITIYVKNGQLQNLPSDFVTESDSPSNDENNGNETSMGRSLLVPMFVVNYGLQNQSYFKNIKLDQREFTETAESLQIIDDLSKPVNGNKPTYYGQNLFNIYQTRSYSTEIEMMGCAQLQPMMYFYLKDIPLFRGAYLIIKVSHDIKANNMTTKFKGVRVKRTKTPLLDKSTVFANMLGNIKIDTKSSRGTTTGSFPQIIGTIIENGGAYGAPESGKITMKKIPEINGVEIDNIVKNNDIKNRLISEATDALEVMLKDFVKFAETNGFNKVGKDYIRIISAFRTVEQQDELVKNNKRATDGSRHCWGIAVDFNFVAPKNSTLELNGGYIVNKYDYTNPEKRKDVFNEVKNPSLKWFLDNSYKYGFVIPYTMRDNLGNLEYEEFWHHEYHGTGAKELMAANPTTYGYTVKVDGTPNPIVKNPKTPSGEIAVYKNYDKTLFEAGDGDETTTTGCPKVPKNKPTVSAAETYKNQIEKLKTGKYVNKNGREQNESFDGFKTIPEFYSNGVLTKKGIAAITLALQEGLGSSPNRKNPGNIRKDSNNYKIYNTWGEGWRALHDRYFKEWVDGNVVKADSWEYPNCNSDSANELFRESKIKFKAGGEYNYKKKGDLPSLRQFVNIYAPWGDGNNPNNYIAGIAKALKDYGYDINVDEPMKSWIT